MGEVKDWNVILQGAEESLFFEARLFYEEALEEDFEDRRKAEAYEYAFKERLISEDALVAKERGFGESFDFDYAGKRVWIEEVLKKEKERERMLFERIFRRESAEDAESVFKSNLKKMVEFERGISRKFEMPDEREFAGFEEYEDARGFDRKSIYDSIILGEEGGVSQRVTGSRKDRILAFTKEGVKERGERMKIEVKNTNNINRDVDIDRVTDSITQRLCEIMSKSADGLY